MKNALAWAGKNGTWVVIAGVVLGFAVPALSESARPWLGVAVFAFTFGSLLKFDWPTFRADAVQGRRNAAMIAWATLGIPLIVYVILRATRLDPALDTGILLWALVPSSGACVAFAALLGLRTSLALLTTIVATAAAPFYLPWLGATLGGVEIAGDPMDMAVQLLVIIGGAWLAAAAVRRFAGTFVSRNPDAMTGIAVLALFVAGLGSMQGMLALSTEDPVRMLMLLGLAYAFLIGAQISGTLLFWRCGHDVALTAGLLCGTRTVTLAWVVLGDEISPLTNAFLGCAMIAKYTAPALLGSVRTRWRAAHPATS